MATSSVTVGPGTQASMASAAFQEAQTPSMEVPGPQSTDDIGADRGDNNATVPEPQASLRIHLRLNRTEATGSNKRPSDVNPPTSPAKRQKKANTMAEPTTANSIRYAHFICTYHTDFYCRNICMRHWKGTQPSGQGLLRDFEAYYKSLSDADKQVRIYLLCNAHAALTNVNCLSPLRMKCGPYRSQRYVIAFVT